VARTLNEFEYHYNQIAAPLDLTPGKASPIYSIGSSATARETRRREPAPNA